MKPTLKPPTPQRLRTKLPGHRSPCGTCEHSKAYHKGDVTFHERRRIIGAGPCSYAAGGQRCGCAAWMKAKAPAQITYSLQTGDQWSDNVFVDELLADGVKLWEVLSFIAFGEERRMVIAGTNIERRGVVHGLGAPRTARFGGKARQYSERPGSHEIRAFILAVYGVGSKMNLAKIAKGLALYKLLCRTHSIENPASRVGFDKLRTALAVDKLTLSAHD